MRIDFTGSAGPHPRNFNAPRAVSIAATLYVLRCLIDEDIPLNAGDRVRVRTPGGGGYGDASDRDPALSAEDKRLGRA